MAATTSTGKSAFSHGGIYNETFHENVFARKLNEKGQSIEGYRVQLAINGFMTKNMPKRGHKVVLRLKSLSV